MRQAGAAPRRVHRVLHDLAQVGPVYQRLVQQVEVAVDDGEQVVEIVRHAAGQLAHDFHLLRLAQPLLADAQRLLGGAALQHHLDGGAQLALRERLQQVAVRLGGARPLQRRFVGIGGEIDDRGMVAGRYACSGVDAVDLAFDVDIHQDEVRQRLLDRLQRLRAIGDIGHDVVAEALQHQLQMEADNPLVFHHHDSGVGHTLRVPD